jgi:peptidoglycan/xylan/chitin deacetylase (PgdA/CDA1 family)
MSPDLPTLEEQRAAVARLAEKGLPVFSGGGRGDYVAITYDDGPSADTGALVRALADSGGRATFFDVGGAVMRYPARALLHTTVGVVGHHSWSHPHLAGVSTAELDAQLDRTESAIGQHVGRPGDGRVFRPPYGEFDERTLAAASRAGLVTVLWNVDPEDWRDGANAARIAERTLEQLVPGGVVLLHDGIFDRPSRSARATIEATAAIVAGCRERGLEPVTVPELLALDPPSDAQLEAGAPGFLGDRRTTAAARPGTGGQGI